MSIFGLKPSVNPFGKMSIFRLFEPLVFMSQKSVFTFQNIIKDIFLAYIVSKKKVGKMVIFGPKPWVNPFGKMFIFRLFELLVFIGQKDIFFVLKYHRIHFPGLYWLKKKVAKVEIFGLKPWVNPFEKISIFRLFKLFVFMAQKGCLFSFQNIIEYIFLVYIASKKKLEKWLFLDQNHGLIPLEKCQFFDFLNFFFLQPRQAFFRSRIS